MIPHQKYKSSGIEWIGDIPEEWEVKKLKYVIQGRLEYGANESAELENTELPRYIRITDFGNDGKLKEDTFKSLPFEVANDYLLSEGDILFARSGATVGKTFQFKDYSGIACFAGYLIRARPNQKILSDFLYSYTKSNSYENWKDSIFNQATIQNIGADKYCLLEIPIPPIEEQKNINKYLDKKTALINTCITKKQKLIELLKEEKTAIINEAVTKGITPGVKLKPSGIEWLGDVPEHWEVTKLKYVATAQPSNIDKKTVEGEPKVLLCNYVDVYKNDFITDNILFMEATAPEYQIEKFKLKIGDVIITKDSETPDDIAVPALVKIELDNLVCGYHLTQIRPDKSLLNGDYLFRL